MAKIRRLGICNFRGIQQLDWCPGPGMNCLIGPGDSSKSTILDAIDLCLGARRNAAFSDTDFFQMDISKPISIGAILGDLPDPLLSFDSYGQYLRGFNTSTGELFDEPAQHLEPVLHVMLTVESDLEPSWTLFSQRTTDEGIVRQLAWKEKVALAPTRIGASSDYNLTWQRGSILNRLTEERADASAALVTAAREARHAFGAQANVELKEALNIVDTTAKQLGVNVGEGAQAMLDSHSVSFGSGTIALHDADGIPLKGMGVGSTRLLISGLQRHAAGGASIVLADELEYGLEPHRIVSLLRSLGSKEARPPMQSFATTHSPIALRELNGVQLWVVRPQTGGHFVKNVGTDDQMQGTIRLYPEAFLAPKIIVCEGATEVGFLRGLDLHRVDTGMNSLTALGTSFIDSKGGHPNEAYNRASAFQSLGYGVMVLRDADIQPDKGLEAAFAIQGGKVVHWEEPFFAEQQLFHSLPATACIQLLNYAIELHGDLVDAHLQTASGNTLSSAAIFAHQASQTALPPDIRTILGKAASIKKKGWFKTVSAMETVAREIVGPSLAQSSYAFQQIVKSIFDWAEHGGS